MSTAIEKLKSAQARAMRVRPKVGGFPHLAEVLRQAGVRTNRWSLPSCQALYLMNDGEVMMQGQPLIIGVSAVAAFNQAALITALRRDQEGRGTFPEFLQSAWQAGVVGYEVDFNKRIVTYFGAKGEKYVEEYPPVTPAD